MLSQIDIAIAIVLAENPGAIYEQISDVLGISVSTAHSGVRQLRASGLMLPDGRKVDRLALLEFLEHGLRYVFPAVPGALKRGVPTAHSGPVLAEEIDVGDGPYVWPSANGTVRGRAIVPLVPRADEIAQRSPNTYAALSLVDALRVGRARERALAIQALRSRFKVPSGAQAL